MPNKTPTGSREGRRASEARNASQSVAGTTRDERDAASRRPPALARRDEARQAPRGVRSLGSGLWPSGLPPRHRLRRCGPICFADGEQRTTLPCGPFLAVHPAWLHRGLVGVLLGTLNVTWINLDLFGKLFHPLEDALSNYPEDMVAPMREELIQVGFQQLMTPAQVDAALQKPGTTLLLVNSVCGCAAAGARPGVTEALRSHGLRFDQLVTVFAGMRRRPRPRPASTSRAPCPPAPRPPS